MHEQDHDWDKDDVSYRLAKAGISLSELSRRHGLSPETLRNVYYRSYPKGERIIAQYLGLEPWEIWPSRYEQKRA
ncbi:helix-turn-helix domain-containing protein [Vibrio mediterranei]|uniref:helix-turn-helix domain-containing protein n=1 Tax=Vibrio mediterranei TaxID=689 RepID=UPI002283EB93|nr:helix-turn-helix domain-containing protein [Vibrio mediterranei]MCY9855437.1 helix-turn-helix domain-containing protein [Vibrio mediterranei]